MYTNVVTTSFVDHLKGQPITNPTPSKFIIRQTPNALKISLVISSYYELSCPKDENGGKIWKLRYFNPFE